MAATIAKAAGYDNNGKRSKETTRLGHASAEAQANTWHTFTTAFVNKDGSGYLEMKRNGQPTQRIDFGPE